MGRTACSLPVMATRDSGCAAAPGAAVNCAVRLVGLATVIVPMVTPGTGLSVVLPCTKCVLTPVIVNVPVEPRRSVTGEICEIAGMFGGRN